MTKNPYQRILAEHTARYPLLEIQDLYKLIFQGVMGSKHAVGDPAQARKWLDTEVASLEDGPVEPLIDPISKNGEIVRIHLRPYIAKDGDLSALNAAFLRTANEHKGTYEELEAFWFSAEHMAADGELLFQRQALRTFFEKMRGLGFPAVHHSEGYTRAYRPAYRVIRFEYMADSLYE